MIIFKGASSPNTTHFWTVWQPTAYWLQVMGIFGGQHGCSQTQRVT